MWGDAVMREYCGDQGIIRGVLPNGCVMEDRPLPLGLISSVAFCLCDLHMLGAMHLHRRNAGLCACV